ncbi:MAG: DUF2235 domain-containing protein [Pseudomonadota bacterium]
MKRIAIFCDGTWNRDDAPHPTNVVRMAQTVRLSASDGVKQQVIYQRGVGAGDGANWLSRKMDTIGGGAFGWGLTKNIEEAYRDLVFCYEPGDEIFIFGFSRGGYTARSLAGLIRSCGIPPRDRVGEIYKAITRYRSRKPETKPDDPESFLFRREFSPYAATSDAEWTWRKQTAPGMCIQLKLAYLGVWDTVGALGVPGFLAVAPFLNRKYKFHDMNLSRSVCGARHAVAIDERRLTFPPSLWDNLERLNKLALAGDDDVSLDPNQRDNWPYRQEWFPGDHGSVGGGGERDGISAATFSWIAEGAQAAGLDMRPEKLDEIAQNRDVCEVLVNTAHAGLAKNALKLLAKDRDGPDRIADVSSFTVERVKQDSSYRPEPLKKVIEALKRAQTDAPLTPP